MAQRILAVIALAFTLFSLSCNQPIFTFSRNVINEVEPNNDYGHANGEIIPGTVYSGNIAKNSLPDEDFFSIDVEAGELYTIRLETDSNSPMTPEVLISSTYFSYYWIVSGSKTTFTVPVLEDGKLFLRISEMKNDDKEDETIYGGPGYSYWFTISRDSFCNKEYDDIGTDESVDFSLDSGTMHYLSFTPRSGWHGIESWCGDKSESDTWLTLFNCTSKLVIAGNDDRDAMSSLFNPWIYREFKNEQNMVLITSPIKQDLRNTTPFQCTVKTVAQKQKEELEPNDTFQFANQIEQSVISGYLEETNHIIEGVRQHDADFFRFDTEKKQMVTIDIDANQTTTIVTELWHFSYNYTSGYYIPLKFNSLSGEGDTSYRLKTFTPFTRGITYLKLQGKDNNYTISTTTTPVSIEREGAFEETFDSDKCSGVVIKWDAPDSPYKAHFISSASGENLAGLYIFADDGSPYTRLDDPNLLSADITLFKLHTGKSWYIMLFPLTCADPDNVALSLSVVIDKPEQIDIPFTVDKNETEAEVNQTYRGFIDSDNYLIENLYHFTVTNDGILTILTAPDFAEGEENLNTVIRLYDEKGEKVDENDNTIYNLWYNRYSQLILKVKKGEKYTLSVKPFMDDSSHIPSLNISTHYILDMKLR
ncbi:hypothetical protein KAH37_00025 [bacterium]|nr:hypothetical protein [bacterium]